MHRHDDGGGTIYLYQFIFLCTISSRLREKNNDIGYYISSESNHFHISKDETTLVYKVAAVTRLLTSRGTLVSIDCDTFVFRISSFVKSFLSQHLRPKRKLRSKCHRNCYPNSRAETSTILASSKVNSLCYQSSTLVLNLQISELPYPKIFCILLRKDRL